MKNPTADEIFDAAVEAAKVRNHFQDTPYAGEGLFSGALFLVVSITAGLASDCREARAAAIGVLEKLLSSKGDSK